jgi:glycosyltransferase involved in cell wall biosynthesis
VVDAALLNTARNSLRQRLEAGAPHIASHSVDVDELSTMELLALLGSTVRREADYAKFWLLMTCISGGMPTHDEMLRAFRALELAEPGTESYELLRVCIGPATGNADFARPVRIVQDSVVVDVDFCARHGHNTGVQRVVRETVSRWKSQHEVLPTAWTEDGSLMRTLDPGEETRVLRWNSSLRRLISGPYVDDSCELLVPWKCTIILPEVAQHRFWRRLACLAEFSPNTVSLVGYDTIPVTSAEYVVPSEADRFVRYLSVVKNADLVAGISQSSADEFAGFASALQAQGLRGPNVVTVNLPVALAAREHVGAELVREHALPLVLCVGTQEPRKNQLAVLAASEVLWKQGLKFELLFIGGSAQPLSIPFDNELWRLKKLGRTVSVLRHGTDRQLEEAYRTARFSVFVSLHEGYGLPVGESLAVGTPVITTNYGSVAEIAEGGGCLSVDPRSDEAITQAMRLLLTDDVEVARLRTEASARKTRTWDDYAAELWSAVTDRAGR